MFEEYAKLVKEKSIMAQVPETQYCADAKSPPRTSIYEQVLNQYHNDQFAVKRSENSLELLGLIERNPEVARMYELFREIL